jgi:hypothetical protein
MCVCVGLVQGAGEDARGCVVGSLVIGVNCIWLSLCYLFVVVFGFLDSMQEW